MQLKLELGEVLSLLSPLPDGEDKPRRRPDAAMRASFFGEETGRFADTPLTLILKSGEDELHITGTADGILPGGAQPYTVEEEIVLPHLADFARWRERCLVRAQFLALALMNTKGLERVKIRLSVFAEGRMELEDLPWEKEALSRALAPRIRSLLSFSCL